MASPTAPTRSTLDRLVAAAAAITCESGWSAVTMGKVAERAGVSRQTVYNEAGSKSGLGQSMVLTELVRFLAVVEEELDGQDEIVVAVERATRRILVMAADNRLLRAVLSAAHGTSQGLEQGASNDLLPFLTTDAGPLMEAAKAVIAARIPSRFPGLDLPAERLDGAVDAIVRLVLSHVMQPGGNPEAVARDVAWIAGRVLGQT
jgi:AcrR family transcriptional regulator